MFLTSCLQINKGAHFLYYGNYSGVFHSPESRKKMRKQLSSSLFQVTIYTFWFLLWFKKIKLHALSSPRSFSFYKQVQIRFIETDAHVTKPKLKLILAILIIENVDHLRCTICTPGFS